MRIRRGKRLVMRLGSRRILLAALEEGLGLRLHAEEIARTGAAGLAA